jgi:hypothetical protein
MFQFSFPQFQFYDPTDVHCIGNFPKTKKGLIKSGELSDQDVYSEEIICNMVMTYTAP